MSPQDQRVIAALALLNDQLDLVIEELLAGQLGQDDRRELARALCTIAGDLDPAIVVRKF